MVLLLIFVAALNDEPSAAPRVRPYYVQLWYAARPHVWRPSCMALRRATHDGKPCDVQRHEALKTMRARAPKAPVARAHPLAITCVES